MRKHTRKPGRMSDSVARTWTDPQVRARRIAGMRRRLNKIPAELRREYDRLRRVLGAPAARRAMGIE